MITPIQWVDQYKELLHEVRNDYMQQENNTYKFN